ncbi:MAG: glycerophosphodiester phosphodiesterase family protein [Polyangiales bacterium]
MVFANGSGSITNAIALLTGLPPFIDDDYLNVAASSSHSGIRRRGKRRVDENLKIFVDPNLHTERAWWLSGLSGFERKVRIDSLAKVSKEIERLLQSDEPQLVVVWVTRGRQDSEAFEKKLREMISAERSGSKPAFVRANLLPINTRTMEADIEFENFVRNPSVVPSERQGSFIDIAQTMLGAVGVSERGCFFGRDLFSVSVWPTRRLVLSATGRRNPKLTIHDSPWLWETDNTFHAAKLFNTSADPNLQRNVWAADDPLWPQLKEFLKSYKRAIDNASIHSVFAPATTRRPRSDLTRATAPKRTIFHRGMGSTTPQTADLFKRALASGYDAVEIDVSISSDGVPVAFSRRMFRAESKTLPIDVLPMSILRKLNAEIVELKDLLVALKGADVVLRLWPLSGPSEQAFADAIVRVVSARKSGNTTVSSSSDALLGLIAQRIDVKTALVIQSGQDLLPWAEYAKRAGIEQVYVDGRDLQDALFEVGPDVVVWKNADVSNDDRARTRIGSKLP